MWSQLRRQQRQKKCFLTNEKCTQQINLHQNGLSALWKFTAVDRPTHPSERFACDFLSGKMSFAKLIYKTELVMAFLPFGTEETEFRIHGEDGGCFFSLFKEISVNDGQILTDNHTKVPQQKLMDERTDRLDVKLSYRLYNLHWSCFNGNYCWFRRSR